MSDTKINGLCDNLEDCKLDVTKKKISDEELFKQPPPEEDCPICLIKLPTLNTGCTYMPCCGKVICSGCCYAPVFDHLGNEVDNEKCAFCRTEYPSTTEEMIKRIKERTEANDPMAIYRMGIYYRDGICGLAQDHTKALELFHRAAELGHADAYSKIGYAHDGGGVEVDEKKAIYYYELAAIRGSTSARFNLGISEIDAGNMKRALNHWMIAVRSGSSKSLEIIKELYSDGYATKEDYTKALRSYQAYLSEIKSDQRDKAAVAREKRYY